MKRARWGGALAIAALVACAELRQADPANDAGPNPIDPTKPAQDGGGETHDARALGDADSGPVTCPAPCEPELISTMENLGPVVVDSFNAYFASANGGVWKIAKTGGKTTKLGDGKTTRLALAADKVYWGEGDHLVACATAGCGALPQGVLLSQTGIDEVVSDGTNIAWHAHDGADEFVRTCPVKNCSSTTVKDVSPAFGLRAGMGTGAGKVFWADLQMKLHVCPFDPLPCTNPPGSIGSGSNDAVVFDQTVYWVYEQVVFSSPVDIGRPKKLGGSESPHLLVADENHIYWREMVGNKVVRCPIAGCNPQPEVIADEVNGVYYGGLALDADYIYWTSKSGLWRRHK